MTSTPIVNSPNNKGFIRVCDLGYFDAYFTVDYLYKGGYYQHVSPELGMYDVATIYIPEEVEYVRYRAYIAVFIKTWQLVCDEVFYYFPRKCYNLLGTVFEPICAIVSCPNAETLPVSTDKTDLNQIAKLICTIDSLTNIQENPPDLYNSPSNCNCK